MAAILPIMPIETLWKDWRFRSQLEARWAVFFDSLKIEFAYEPEGFEIQGGLRYLPDFHLQHVRMWAEVKPVTFTDIEKRKVLGLVDSTGCPCLLLVGPPAFRTYSAIHAARLDEGTTERYECDYLLDVDYHGRKFYDKQGRFVGDVSGFHDASHFSEQYRQAIHLALSARFGGGRW